jgi:hypothetical protein
MSLLRSLRDLKARGVRAFILYEPLLLIAAFAALFAALLAHSMYTADTPVDPGPVLTNTISVHTPYVHPFPPPIAPVKLRAAGNGFSTADIAILTYATPETPGGHRASAMSLLNFRFMSDAERAARVVKHPLVTHLIPSLVATLDPAFKYSLLIGFDYEDPLFDNELARRALDAHLAALASRLPSSSELGYPVLSFFFVPLYGVASQTARLNHLASLAHTMANDFFVLATATTEFRRRGWATAAIAALTGDPTLAHARDAATYEPTGPVFPGFGVVSLPDSALPDVPRTLIFSRVHLALFSLAFPLPWAKHAGFADSWLAQVYKPWRAAPHLSPAIALVTDHATVFYLTAPGNAQLPNPRISLGADTEPGDVGVYQTLQDGLAPYAMHELARQVTKGRKRLNMLLLGEYAQPMYATHAAAETAARAAAAAIAAAPPAQVSGPGGVFMPPPTPARAPYPHETGGARTAAHPADSTALAAGSTVAAAAARVPSDKPTLPAAVPVEGLSTARAAADKAAGAAPAAGSYVSLPPAHPQSPLDPSRYPMYDTNTFAGGAGSVRASASPAVAAAAASAAGVPGAGAAATAAIEAAAAASVSAGLSEDGSDATASTAALSASSSSSLVSASAGRSLLPPLTGPEEPATAAVLPSDLRAVPRDSSAGAPSMSLSVLAPGVLADTPDIVISHYDVVELPDIMKPFGRAIPAPSFHLVNSFDKCVYHEDACAREAKKYLGKKIATRWM